MGRCLDEEIELYRRWWAEGWMDGALVVDLHDHDARITALGQASALLDEHRGHQPARPGDGRR
ncbi:hypothetical protein [Streptomyces rimosus]|uniref:hypothetical protein n=1 Tax=Streptomyces rimosus TaxID=1927 RepID=UPI0004CA9505|nr:hypothetical protein [Streptomyces rimosus]